MAEDKSHKVMIETAGYKGPDRRGESPIVIAQCQCHPKHERVLHDHDERIKNIEEGRERRRESLDKEIDEKHNNMWEAIKSKVSNPVFYVFITVYTFFFVAGIAAVYTGMHKIDKNLTEKIAEVKAEVAVTNTKIEYNTASIRRVEKQVEKINQKLDNHIEQTINGEAHRRSTK